MENTAGKGALRRFCHVEKSGNWQKSSIYAKIFDILGKQGFGAILMLL